MKPIYLSNASKLGYSKPEAARGDLVFWSCYAADGSVISRNIGRVIGTVARDGMGKEYRKPSRGTRTKAAPHLHVLKLSDNAHYAYPVHVDPDDVQECRAPMAPDALAFIAFFFGGDLPEVKEIEATCHAGAMSTSYFANSTRDGVWIPFSERNDSSEVKS